MDVKIITCHNVYNYGASLQAFALQNTVSSMGNDCEIIDYNPWYLYDRYQFLAINNSKWSKNILTKVAYLILKLPRKMDFLFRKKSFALFNKEYLKLTVERYYTNEELKNCFCDVLICGSDQIWNTNFENGKDLAFFGGYTNSKHLISYAASLGMDRIPVDKEEWFRTNLSKFDAVSVREKTAFNELNRIGINDVSLCIDPVYLLSKEEWIRNFDLVHKNERYLLVYFFEVDDSIIHMAQDIARSQNLKIYSINSTKCDYADKSFHHYGPKEFLNLVLNATIILTNSFHGMSFSIIFQKDFWTVSRNGLNTRISDMLDSINLSDRQIETKTYKSKAIDKKINYMDVQPVLKKRVEESKNYLFNLLKNFSYEEML